MTELDPDSRYAFHVGDSVVVIGAAAEIRDPSNNAKVLGSAEAAKVLKIEKMKNGRLLVDAGGKVGRGWMQSIQVVKQQKEEKPTKTENHGS